MYGLHIEIYTILNMELIKIEKEYIVCGYCSKTVEKKSKNHKYCNVLCGQKHRRILNPNPIRESERKYWDKNREKRNEQKRNHHSEHKEEQAIRQKNRRTKDKDKFLSRGYTLNLLKGINRIKIYHMSKECIKCGELKNLEVHHEVYPLTMKEIREALDNKQIYYLCRRCHGKTTRKD